MDECIGRYFAKRNELIPSSEFNQNFIIKGHSVYEVIRIINGRALFLEEHLERLWESVRLSKLHIASDLVSIDKTFNEVVARNNILYGNVKLVVNFCGKRQPDTYVYFIPHSYPSSKDYRHGVAVSISRSIRRDPNIKKFTGSTKNLNISPGKLPVHECLLVNNHDQITEGSRSNVFLITGKDVYTAPDELVLKGITRKKVLEILNVLNYNIITSAVSINDLINFNTAFLTGTSLKVLPIQYLDGKKLHVENPVLQNIMKEYDKMIEEYLERSSKN